MSMEVKLPPFRKFWQTKRRTWKVKLNDKIKRTEVCLNSYETCFTAELTRQDCWERKGMSQAGRASQYYTKQTNTFHTTRVDCLFKLAPQREGVGERLKTRGGQANRFQQLSNICLSRFPVVFIMMRLEHNKNIRYACVCVCVCMYSHQRWLVGGWGGGKIRNYQTHNISNTLWFHVYFLCTLK